MAENLLERSDEYLQQVIDHNKNVINQLRFGHLGLAGYTEGDENAEELKRQIEEAEAEIARVEELLARRASV